MIYLVPTGQRIWQAVAQAYRPPNLPFALYGDDERMGAYHAATLGLNFQLGVNTLSLHNAWLTGDWYTGYPLRIPNESWMVTFPRMLTPQEAANAIGYDISPPTEDGLLESTRPAVRPSDVPAWVQAYVDWLLNQVDMYGSVVRRESMPGFF